jgi:hypothetical protein
MKKYFLLVFAMVTANILSAQNIGFGTNTPHPSAMLDVTSTTKGFLIPRMTSAQRLSIATPAAGLMVYETTTNSFWFYNGTVWNQLGTGGLSPWTVSGSNIYSSNTGNVGIGTSTGLLEKLSVKGNLFVTHVNPNDITNGGNRAEFNLHGAGTGSGRVNFLNSDTTVGAFISHSNLANRLTLQNGANTSQLVLHSNGNVGIGTSSPAEPLDVFGNIRSRDTITADDDIVAGDDIRAGGRVIATGLVSSASGLSTSGGLTVSSNGIIGGNLTVNADLSTNGDLIINNSGATVQLKNGSNINKGFFQLSGDDVRFGTNSGNNLGNVIVRMNGNNRFTFTDAGRFTLSADNTPTINFISGGDPKASLQVQGEDLVIRAPSNKVRISNLIYADEVTDRVGIGTISPTERLHVSGNTVISGNLNVSGNTHLGSGKVTRDGTGTNYNLLPVCYGKVNADGSIQSGTQNFTVTKPCDVSTGCYLISSSAFTNSSVIMITVSYALVPGSVPVVANYNYDSPGKFYVFLQDSGDDRINANFNFVVFNP